MPVTIGAKLESDFTDPIGLLGDCHRRIERFLGVIVAVAERARGAELDAEQRRALDTALRYFREAAPRHVADEEESLFPRLRQGGSAAAIETLRRLEQDHQTIEPWHAEVDRLGRRWLADGRMDLAAATRFQDLARRLQQVYEPHIAMEDGELFPQARQALDAEQLSGIGQEMAARRGITHRKSSAG
jgi:hemerythrin-like domain-containing protein